MISFTDVDAHCSRSLSFEIRGGEACKFIVPSDCDERDFLHTIVGLNRPSNGRVRVLGRDIYALDERQLVALFQRVAVVWRGGGVVSNLKVWENIALPVCYHFNRRPEEIEGRVVEICRAIGMDASPQWLASLPDPLPESEKSLIGVVRAMLMEPELILYDSIFVGQPPEIAARLAAVVTSFHAQEPGRTSVYIGTDEAALARVPADRCLNMAATGSTT